MPVRFVLLILLIIATATSFYLYKEKKFAGDWGLALDDSWIHMVFARNLASGQGFSFNAGEPISGSTSPLWVVVMALGFLLGVTPVWSAKLIGAALLIGTCIYVYRVTLELTGGKYCALLTSLTVALCPYLTWGALSGMETPLYTFLSVLGVWLHLRYSRSENLRRYLPTLIFTLAGLARPECFLLLIFSWGDILIYQLLSKRAHSWRVASLPALISYPVLFLVLTAPWLLFNYSTTGTLLPNTYVAKVGSGGLLGALRTGDLPAAITTLSIKPLYMLLISIMVIFKSSPLLLAFFGLGLLRIARLSRNPASDLSPFIVPMAALLYPLGMGVFGHVQSLAQSHRYVHNLFPIFYLVSSIGLFSVWPVLTGQLSLVTKGKRGGAFILGTGALLVVVLLFAKPLYLWSVNQIGPHTSLTHLSPKDLEFYWGNLVQSGTGISMMLLCAGGVLLLGEGRHLAFGWKRVISAVVLTSTLLSMAGADFSYANLYALNVKNINDMHITLGRWLDENTPQEAVVALGDVGGISYTSRRRVIDIAGLMTPGIIPYQQRYGQEGILEYFREVECPDYLVIYQDMYSRLLNLKGHFQQVFEVQIEDNTVCGYERMAVFKVQCEQGQRSSSISLRRLR